jgi:TrpR-related protein YerC/YecD
MSIDPAEWRTESTDELFDVILGLSDRAAAERFFRDLCTLRELHDLAQRWHVVRLLDEGHPYAEISRMTGASTATITRIAGWLHHGTGGYRDALARLAERASEDRVVGASAGRGTAR